MGSADPQTTLNFMREQCQELAIKMAETLKEKNQALEEAKKNFEEATTGFTPFEV